MVYESGFTTRRTYTSRPVTTSYAVTVSFENNFTALTRKILRYFLDVRIEVVWCSIHKICAIHLCGNEKSAVKLKKKRKWYSENMNEPCVYIISTCVSEDFMKRVSLKLSLS